MSEISGPKSANDPRAMETLRRVRGRRHQLRKWLMGRRGKMKEWKDQEGRRESCLHADAIR